MAQTKVQYRFSMPQYILKVAYTAINTVYLQYMLPI